MGSKCVPTYRIILPHTLILHYCALLLYSAEEISKTPEHGKSKGAFKRGRRFVKPDRMRPTLGMRTVHAAPGTDVLIPNASKRPRNPMAAAAKRGNKKRSRVARGLGVGDNDLSSSDMSCYSSFNEGFACGRGSVQWSGHSKKPRRKKKSKQQRMLNEESDAPALVREDSMRPKLVGVAAVPSATLQKNVNDEDVYQIADACGLNCVIARKLLQKHGNNLEAAMNAAFKASDVAGDDVASGGARRSVARGRGLTGSHGR